MDAEESLADRLRQAREEQGKTLEQVHRQTGISLHVLQSLEAGAFTVVEPVYVRLALRSYAENLGLDAARIVRQFDILVYQPPPPPSMPPAPSRFSLARLWAILRH